MKKEAAQKHTIRTYAVVIVSITSIFVMCVVVWLVNILAAPNWCARAINAERLADARQASAVELCKDLLLEQVQALARNSHIFAATIALCLLVLMVIVIAGGKLSFKADKTGLSGNIGEAEQNEGEEK